MLRELKTHEGQEKAPNLVGAWIYLYKYSSTTAPFELYATTIYYLLPASLRGKYKSKINIAQLFLVLSTKHSIWKSGMNRQDIKVRSL